MSMGRELCKFPLEPTFAKSLLAAYRLRCESDATKLISILSSENLWLMVNREDGGAQKRFSEVKVRYMFE